MSAALGIIIIAACSRNRSAMLVVFLSRSARDRSSKERPEAEDELPAAGGAGAARPLPAEDVPEGT